MRAGQSTHGLWSREEFVSIPQELINQEEVEQEAVHLNGSVVTVREGDADPRQEDRLGLE